MWQPLYWASLIAQLVKNACKEGAAAAAATKSLQSCPTLCNPIDGSPPGSPIPGILQARTLEWVAISFSNAWKWKLKVKSLGHVQLLEPGSIPRLGRSPGEGIGYPPQYSWASLVAQLVKNLPVMRETWVQSLGWEELLEKGKATHSSILAWRIPWTVHGVPKNQYDWATFSFFLSLWKGALLEGTQQSSS